MDSYTVATLARIAGVSVRTLHHYDQIGLLKPTRKSGNGYRIYGEAELHRLQQILFFREIEVPLETIRTLMRSPGYDSQRALEEHRRLLEAKARRIKTLISTLDKTLSHLKGENMITEEELYEGFTDEEAQKYKAEASSRWGEQYEESNKRLRKLTKVQFQALKDRGGELWTKAGTMTGLPPESAEVQTLMKELFDYLGNFYTVTPEIFEGLGNLYVESPDFGAFFAKIGTGLPEFLQKAMKVYADRLRK